MHVTLFSKKLRGTTTILTNATEYFFTVCELRTAVDILRSILHIEF